MKRQKKFKRWLDKISIHIRIKLDISMSGLANILQYLWQTLLGSNLPKKDKAEILRLLIYATVIITAIIYSRQ